MKEVQKMVKNERELQKIIVNLRLRLDEKQRKDKINENENNI